MLSEDKYLVMIGRLKTVLLRRQVQSLVVGGLHRLV